MIVWVVVGFSKRDLWCIGVRVWGSRKRVVVFGGGEDGKLVFRSFGFLSLVGMW